MAAGALIALFALLLVWAAVSDLLTMRIPNGLTLGLAIMFPAAAFIYHLGYDQILFHIVAGVAVLIVSFGFFALNWVGGGDAKLAAGIGLWYGLELLMPWLVMTALFGGALTVLILLLRKMPLPYLLHGYEWAHRLHDHQNGIPYGVAIAAGALWVLPMSPWIKVFM